jgi:hypothetical protein
MSWCAPQRQRRPAVVGIREPVRGPRPTWLDRSATTASELRQLSCSHGSRITAKLSTRPVGRLTRSPRTGPPRRGRCLRRLLGRLAPRTADESIAILWRRTMNQSNHLPEHQATDDSGREKPRLNGWG